MDRSTDGIAQTAGPLATPTPERVAATQLSAFISHCSGGSGHSFAAYPQFERWCIEQAPEFWTLLLEWCAVLCEGSRTPARVGTQCQTAEFFPQLRLNYVENLLRLDRTGFDSARPALSAVHADRPTGQWTRGELRERVEALAAALAAQGLGPGSRVAILAHNTSGAVLGCLAAAALGCTVCTGAPDMGTPALLARFAQVEPVLLMADLPELAGGPKQRERLAELARALPSLRCLLLLDGLEAPPGLELPVLRVSELLERHRGHSVPWPRLPFNHPLFILFTSGTTGAPKCLVHGAGGTLLEHLKEHRLHCDLAPADKLFFQTSTGWMMWNWQLSALASGVELVLYDGPVAPVDRLWRIVSEQCVTAFGTSPAYLQLCESAGLNPRTAHDFSALRQVFSTGSILYPRQQDWLWNCVKPLPVQSISGGTDIVGCFVLGNPNLPVYSALCQSRSLGLDVRALGAQPGQPGELVCANPFPSRPLGFLGDPAGERFHAAYFAANPGMWTHGDLVELTGEGARMHGRSDGVLNIRGIRIGPAEIYRILAEMPEIAEAMAVEQQADEEPGGARLVLLLVLRESASLGEELPARLRRELARRASAAHVPGTILAVPELPTTHSGKRSERSARDALNGRPVLNLQALRNPQSLEPLRAHAAAGRPPAPPTMAAGATLDASALARMWEQVLQIAPVAPDDSFFDLGGDSLKALQIISRIRAASGREIPLTLMFEAPTVRSLAQALQRSGVIPYRPLVRLRDGQGPPLFIVHGVGGSVMELRGLAQRIHANAPICAIQARGFEPGDAPNSRVEDMAAEYLAAVRSQQPAGPYYLVGYSFGGLVAYEMARVLSAGGQHVALLALLDTTVHELYWPRAAWIEYFVRRLRGALRSMSGHGWRQLAPYGLRLWRSLHARLKRRYQTAEALDRSADDAELPETVRRVRRAGLLAMTTYRPAPSRLQITVLRSELSQSPLCDPFRVWQSLAPEVRVFDVPGDHASMIRPPHVQVLAQRLTECARAALGDPLPAGAARGFGK